MNPTIALLLTCHNRKDKTLQCLTDLFVQQGLNVDFKIEVFLVDDASTDGTAEAIENQFPHVTVISGNGNLFWNRGMHLAWKTAADMKEFDYYLWLNDDTSLYPGAVQELLNCSLSENNNKIICGSTTTKYKNEITYGGRLLKRGLVIPNGFKQVCDYFNGNIVLIPNSVYSVLGTNDYVFHHSLGDFDYGLRAKKKGIISIVSPNILGICDANLGTKLWCNPEISIIKRISNLYSVLGNNPFEYFRFNNRHNGLLIACFNFLTNHFRVLMPAIWIRFKKY